MIKSFFGVGQGQEIRVSIACVAAPTEMVGNHGWSIALTQACKPLELLEICSVMAAQREAYGMKAERHFLCEGRQPAMRWSAISKVILRVDFKPARQSGVWGDAG
jgi:hypothetical protein